MNIILIILVFGVIVFFHEFGHFIVAKMNKIAVMEFSIGMGPAIFQYRKGDEIFPAFTADWWVLHDDGGRWRE